MQDLSRNEAPTHHEAHLDGVRAGLAEYQLAGRATGHVVGEPS